MVWDKGCLYLQSVSVMRVSLRDHACPGVCGEEVPSAQLSKDGRPCFMRGVRPREKSCAPHGPMWAGRGLGVFWCRNGFCSLSLQVIPFRLWLELSRNQFSTWANAARPSAKCQPWSGHQGARMPSREEESSEDRNCCGPLAPHSGPQKRKSW